MTWLHILLKKFKCLLEKHKIKTARRGQRETMSQATLKWTTKNTDLETTSTRGQLPDTPHHVADTLGQDTRIHPSTARDPATWWTDTDQAGSCTASATGTERPGEGRWVAWTHQCGKKHHVHPLRGPPLFASTLSLRVKNYPTFTKRIHNTNFLQTPAPVGNGIPGGCNFTDKKAGISNQDSNSNPLTPVICCRSTKRA